MRIGPMLAAAVAVLPVMALAADSVQMAPGRWMETFTTTGATVAGKAVPASALGEPASKAVCMSAAEAADPQTYFQSRSGAGGSCAAPTGSVAGGTLALASTCARPDGATVAIEVKGGYSKDSYNAAIRAQDGTGAAQTVVTMTVSGKYEGACRGDENKE